VQESAALLASVTALSATTTPSWDTFDELLHALEYRNLHHSYVTAITLLCSWDALDELLQRGRQAQAHQHVVACVSLHSSLLPAQGGQARHGSCLGSVLAALHSKIAKHVVLTW
jgi:hypothetical protein